MVEATTNMDNSFIDERIQAPQGTLLLQLRFILLRQAPFVSTFPTADPFEDVKLLTEDLRLCKLEDGHLSVF